MELPQNYEFLRPLVTGWLGKIDAGRRSRSKWDEVSQECVMFYSKSAAAMWDSKYQKKFWKGVPAPRFRVTINKAFEMVAVFGPNLIWDVPHRRVTPKRPKQIPIELFGDPQDEQVQMFYQQVMSSQQQETMDDDISSHLLQTWLNYTSREMPGGGLEEHSMLAVVDALIKGRGCLWVRPYRFPGSQRTLTGCFHESPENLITDPDFKKLSDCKWIALRRVQPHWEVEQRFGLKKDSLKNKATLESSWIEGEYATQDMYTADRVAGKTNDMIVYYEIWSKTGAGSKLSGMETAVKDHLEDTVGQYAWICVTPNVPYPLNCSSEALRSGIGNEEVKEKFAWPIETWRDDRWPLEVLDFYPDPESSWPVAPLAPAMGELKFLNVMIPHLMNRIWSSSRDFWAVVAPAYNEFVRHLKEGEDQTVFSIPPALGNKVSDVVQVLQQPQTNLDVWKIIEAVSELFDKRTGLSEFMYGMNVGGTQDRTAETTSARREQAGVRPAYMSKVVTSWQSRLAALEAMTTHAFIRSNDVQPLMGQTFSALWDHFITSKDPEEVARQMQFTVAASSIKRPNRDRDVANINQMTSVWLPIATQTGSFDAINEMIRRWGEASEINTEGLEMTAPEPDPMEQQMQQEQMQLEREKMQAEIQKMEMEKEKIGIEAQVSQQEAQTDAQLQMLDIQSKQGETEANMLSQIMDMEMDDEKHDQEMTQDMQKHRLEMLQARQKFAQDLEQQRKLESVKVAVAKQQAKKPSTNGSSK